MKNGEVFINFDDIRDKRYKNYLKALAMFVDELINLEYKTFGEEGETNKLLGKILDKYSIELIENNRGDYPSVNIDFPDGVQREQVFKRDNGTFYTQIVK